MSNFLSGIIMNNILLLVYFVIIDTAMMQLLYLCNAESGNQGYAYDYRCVWGILPLLTNTLATTRALMIALGAPSHNGLCYQ